MLEDVMKVDIEKLAFKYYEETANEDLAAGQLFTGYCYSNGIGIEKDSKNGCLLV